MQRNNEAFVDKPFDLIHYTLGNYERGEFAWEHSRRADEANGLVTPNLAHLTISLKV